jgi:hypothetical protein
VHPDTNLDDASATPAFQFLRQAFEEMKKSRDNGMMK